VHAALSQVFCTASCSTQSKCWLVARLFRVQLTVVNSSLLEFLHDERRAYLTNVVIAKTKTNMLLLRYW
jgi:hypothetical protein